MTVKRNHSVESRFSFLGNIAWGNLNGPRSRVSASLLYDLATAVGKCVTWLAGICVLAPAFEVKVAAGLGLLEVGEAYAAVREHLEQMRIDVPTRQGTDPVVSRIDEWPTVADIADHILPKLLSKVRKLVCETDRLAEWPSVRLFERRVLPGLEVAQELLQGLRGGIGQASEALSHMADRDSRYTTFDNTRDYRSRRDFGDGLVGQESLLSQVRTQRDELDAVETFARLVAADGTLPARDLIGLCRVVADEARHTMMGELGLGMLGSDPMRIPIGTIGAELRRQLDPWDGLAQICLIGECGNLRAIGASVDEASALGHSKLAHMLSTIDRDERHHIAFGIGLLSAHWPDKTALQLRADTLGKTNGYLSARGIAPLELAEAARLIGE